MRDQAGRRMFRFGPVIVILAALAGAPEAPGRASTGALPPHVPGEILVKLRRGAGLAPRESARSLVEATRLKSFRTGAELWKTAPGLTTQEALARLHGHPGIEYAEPNWIVQTNLAPDDPLYGQLWGLNNTGQTGGAAGADISAEGAWDIQTGSRDVLVGVIDTGIDMAHPDLAANIWTNPGEIPGNGVDDDQNGFVDDLHGWDFVNNDNDPFDDHSHGTHVAGTIGAVGNDGVGVAGVSWSVSLIALKFLGAGGSGATSDAMAAVEYATAMGLDVVNNSWSGSGFSQSLLDAIRAADAAGVLFVASAGNDAVDTDSTPQFPAAYDAPNVISVAATDHADRLAGFSNYGLTTVDLGAPGVAILSSIPGRHARFSGTSMAAPHVSGVAALLRAASPGLPLPELRRALLDFTDPIPALAGITVTGGRLNARRSLSGLDTIPPGAITDLAASDATSSGLTLTWTAGGDDGEAGSAASYDVRWSTTPLDEESFSAATRAGGAPVPGPSGFPQTMEVLGLPPDTTCHLAIKARDEAGNAGPISNIAIGTTLPPPVFSASPAGFTVSLLTGLTAARTLTLANAGDGTLDWRVLGAPAWLGAAPAGGRIWSGTQQEVVLSLDASELGGGRHEGALLLGSNDPLVPQASIPVTLDVTDAPAISVSPSAFDLGTVFIGFPSTRALTVSNEGTLPLIAGIRSDHPDVTVSSSSLSIPPATAETITVTVVASAEASLAASLIVESNAPNAPLLTLPVAAGAIPAPGIAMNPASFSESLLTGGVAVRSLEVTNTGGSDLLLTIDPHLPSLPGGLSVSSTAAIIQPGWTREILVTFSGRGSGTAVHSGEMRIGTNVPGASAISVPVLLSVTAAPDVQLQSGEPIVLESILPYAGQAATTTHPLPVAVSPAGDGTLELLADGDYGYGGETATVRLDGTTLGEVGGTSAEDCSTAAGAFPVSVGLLAQAGADGVAQVMVTNSREVDSFCDVNQHAVRLSYPGRVDRLDFGQVYVGTTRSLAVRVHNAGAAPLNVTSISVNHSDLEVVQSAISVAPGATGRVEVGYAPAGANPISATLTLEGDDPDTPVLRVPVTGQGIEPPVAGVSPSFLASALHSGAQEVRALTVSNAGDGPLEFVVIPDPLIAPRPGAAQPAGLQDGEPVPCHGASACPAGSSPVAPSGSPDGLPGEFEPLARSPEPLGTVTEDRSAGVIYAQTHQGTSFYRYRAVANRWEPLAPAPIASTNNGGAALLNGRIYTSYPAEDSLMGVYDIATDSWSVIPHPLGFGTGIIAGDDRRYLYLLGEDSFVRFDPSNPSIESLPPPPFTYSRWGGMRFYFGVLYAHQGNGGYAFASYDTAAREWTRLASLPGGAVLGAALDPQQGEYYAYGSHGQRGLYRYRIDRRAWSVSAIPAFEVVDGGMGWLPFPVAGVCFVEGEAGRGFERFHTEPGAIRVAPESGTIPPGASIDLQVVFDAANRLGAFHAVDFQIVTNDPFAPRIVVPASLTITGTPVIELRNTVELESVEAYEGTGSSTRHVLRLTEPPPPGDGRLEVIAQGDYGFVLETVTVTAEGTQVGIFGGTSGVDCIAATERFTLPSALVAALADDGVVEVQVQNGTEVHDFCGLNQHTVRLSLLLPEERLEFGEVLVGSSRTLPLSIVNTGTDVLHAGPIAAGGEFAVAPAAVTLKPGESSEISITVTAASAGPLPGQLTIASNDPAVPVLTVMLSALAVLPPAAALYPAGLVAALPPGGETARTLRLSNDGGSDLIWSVGGPEAPLPAWITVAAPGGRVPAGGSADIELTVSAASLPDGDHAGTVIILSNDPVHGRLEAALLARVGEVTPDSLVVEPATLGLGSNGPTVKASVQLPAGLDPRDVVPSSVRMNGVLAPLAERTSFADQNGDGRPELILRFDRAAVMAVLPEGQSVTVTLTGEVRDRTWFRGAATVRVIRPGSRAPGQ